MRTSRFAFGIGRTLLYTGTDVTCGLKCISYKERESRSNNKKRINTFQINGRGQDGKMSGGIGKIGSEVDC